MSKIDNNGLTGPHSGKVSVDYEFCIPGDEDKLQRITGIDADIMCDEGGAEESGAQKASICVSAILA